MKGLRSPLALLALGAALLSACDLVPTSPRPEPRGPVVVPEDVTFTPSPRSEALSAYYATVQRQLLAQGLLRKDGGGPDTPFAKRNLVDNFVQIAAFEEYTIDGLRAQQSGNESRIRRWAKPISMRLEFGNSVLPEQAAPLQAAVEKYIRRLSRITGQRMSLAPEGSAANFHVAVLDVDELEAFAPRLQELVPGLTSNVARELTRLPRPQYCAIYTFFDASAPHQINNAVAILRTELPPLLSEACIHEEIAQGLGLSNDSPAARPSIFNDDDEFALLTTHDERLLEILYDPRLPLGTGPAEARPIVETIATDLLGGES